MIGIIEEIIPIFINPCFDMKRLSLFLIISVYFSIQSLFAQNSTVMSAHLSKLLFKIQNADSLELQPDTLGVLNKEFESALSQYARVSTQHLNEAFKKLSAIYSEDKNIGILPWDTNLGGTQHFFENAFLFNTPNGFKLKLDTLSEANNKSFSRSYEKIYMLRNPKKTFYLITFSSILDLKENIDGIQVFSIENGMLNDNTRIIKTAQGITNKISYRYIQSMENNSGFVFEPKLQTISFPVVDQKGHKTDNTITYKFNGQYFEKIK